MQVQGEVRFDYAQTGREVEISKGGPNPNEEDEVLLVRNRISRIYYLKKFFDYPISLKIDTLKNMGLKKTIQSGLSYTKTIFSKKKRIP